LELQYEIIFLYRGEFLEGFDLSEWGEAYRAGLRTKFLEMVTRAAEYPLETDEPGKALEVVE
jgi:two-component SAPR family response regulator